MEQKKTLWIIAGVGIFLLVVIGAALILYSPTQTVEPSIASLQVQNDTWAMPGASASSVRGDFPPAGAAASEAQQGSALGSAAVSSVAAGADGNAAASTDGAAQTVDGMTVYSGTTNVYGTGTTTIDLNSLKYNAPAQTSSVTPENQAAANAISSASTAKASSYQSDQRAASPAGTAAAAVAGSSASAETASGSASAAKPAASSASGATASAKAATSSASKPKSNAKTVSASAAKLPDQYWVQAASFTSKSNADDARAALTENKIDSEVFTYTDSSGKVYYRLRVGPYTTKTEAEYWRSRIVLIEEFADSQSYVTNSSAKKS